MRVSWDLVTHLFQVERERDTLSNEDFLYKYKFPLQKGNFYSVFRVSPVSTVSQNNPYAKETYKYLRVAYSATFQYFQMQQLKTEKKAFFNDKYQILHYLFPNFQLNVF